jgi:hypothetical protein
LATGTGRRYKGCRLAGVGLGMLEESLGGGGLEIVGFWWTLGIRFSGEKEFYVRGSRRLGFGKWDLGYWVAEVGQVKVLLVGQAHGILVVHYFRRVMAKLFRLIIVVVNPPGRRSQVYLPILTFVSVIQSFGIIIFKGIHVHETIIALYDLSAFKEVNIKPAGVLTITWKIIKPFDDDISTLEAILLAFSQYFRPLPYLGS